MRRLAILLAALSAFLAVSSVIDGFSGFASAGERIRLAQTSAVTTCMMVCNSQAAACQSGCLVPGTAPTGAATVTSNATANTSCQLGCSTQQITCQTICGRTSPSQ